MADAVGGLRARPKTTVVLAVLLLSAGLTLGLAREALADYYFNCATSSCGWGFDKDSDGYVPTSTGSLNSTYGTWIVYGRTSSYTSGSTSWDYIKFDWVATDYCNVSRNLVVGHENAHSRGWGHGRGTRSQNAAYDAQVQYCYP